MSFKSVLITCTTQDDMLVAAAARLLARDIRERSGATIAAKLGDPATQLQITLELQPGIGEEGFAIRDAGNGICIAGNDGRGLIYGVGKLLRDATFGDKEISFGPWRGVSVPAKTVRGIYFATHFYNFYHTAPLEEVQRYVEDLALYGCNALNLWFDMHHYNGISDPEAQHMIRRLRAIYQTAESVGIRPGLGGLANEAYENSPEELRADWTAGHDGYTRPPGGHYHREICPSKPGGLPHILEKRREMLEAFADIKVGYFWIWPYDQGGCTCSKCAPWGSNGYLRTAEPLAKLVKEFFPEAKIILSTWYFNHFIKGEWESLEAKFANGAPEWIDYLMSDDCGHFDTYPLAHGFPGNLPAVSFPEISMFKMSPWGGYGANPQPRLWQNYWDCCGKAIDGFYPYSEGIYEDLNKFLLLQWGWNPEQNVADIVRAYAAYHFAPEVAEEVWQATLMLEGNLGHQRPRFPDTDPPQGATEREKRLVYPASHLAAAEQCFAQIRTIEVKLCASTRKSWRWRILWLRAALDAAISASAGEWTAEIDGFLIELQEIYRTNQKTQPPVNPPSKAVMEGQVRTN